MSFQTAFQPTAFTSAFQIAETYAEKKRRGGASAPGSAYLIPYGPVYSDERYVIVRGKLGSGLAVFERHYEYVEDPIEQRVHAEYKPPTVRVAEGWLNTAEPVRVTARVKNVETETE